MRKMASTEEISMRIFDKMEKFAAYGFNKSHAAAYGYHQLYHCLSESATIPTEWMAALMTCDRDDLTKVGKWIREAQGLALSILATRCQCFRRCLRLYTSGHSFCHDRH